MSKAQQYLRELAERDGKRLCPECSKPNWDVYHEPGQHTFPSDEAIAQGAAAVGAGEPPLDEDDGA